MVLDRVLLPKNVHAVIENESRHDLGRVYGAEKQSRIPRSRFDQRGKRQAGTESSMRWYIRPAGGDWRSGERRRLMATVNGKPVLAIWMVLCGE